MRELLFVSIVALSVCAEAREYSPARRLAENADAYSMKTFRQFSRWRDLEGDALAWEVYKYLVDRRTGVFHMNQVLEGRDTLSEFRTVRDPVKIINVYGYGYCAIFGPVMAGVWEDMGMGPARTVVLPDWKHVTSEVFYDDRWHYVDVDVRAVFRRPDGTLASMADARRDASLWADRGPLFFPNDPLEKTQEIYRRTPVWHFHRFNQSGHTMDFLLRQGETLTRWWLPQGGRWHHDEVYHQNDWLRKLIEKPPRGPKPNHRHFTVHNHANGRFLYEPNLIDRSTDFLDGVCHSENVESGPEGLTLVQAGQGHAVFEVRSPYVIVPLVGKMETTDDDREASVVALDGNSVFPSISTDGGLSWIDLPEVSSGPATIDLTRHVAGGYGYLLKLSLRGQPNESLLRSLCITTWVQLAPASLPSLAEGANQMEYRTGDHHGLNTRVVEVRSNASTPDGLLKYLVTAPDDYDPDRRTSHIRGALTVKVESPPGTKIAWFTAGASFRTHLHEAASKNRNTIEYAVDAPRDFREIYRADVPTDTEHWHYNAHPEVRLERPVGRIFVRYFGDPAINNFHIYAHVLDEDRRSDSSVVITHRWSEDSRSKEKTVRLSEPRSYEVLTEAEPANESIEISVTSSVRASEAARSPRPASS